MTRSRVKAGPRDQHESAFATILLKLCASTGALSSALVDREGETVDYAGRFDPYEIRVTAAELQIVLEMLRRSSVAGVAAEQFLVRTSRRGYAVIALSDGYALVLTLPRGSFRVSRRGVAEAVRELEREAGLTYAGGMRRRAERWSHVEVRAVRGDPRRPEAILTDGTWSPLTILGRFRSHDLARQEVGYRARLPNGAEFALVREPPGRWFAEDL